jgi:hypothetical protein
MYQQQVSTSTKSGSPHRRKRLRAWQESYDGGPITADDVLAAARRHNEYLRTVPPREYQMRVFEDGSVFFRNTKIPGLERLFSLVDIIKASRHFYLSPHRPLWKHILLEWL